MRFVLFVEGDTERKGLPEFLKRWLDARFPTTRTGVHPVHFVGSSLLLKDACTKAHQHLQDPAVIAVVALLDLYGRGGYPEDRRTVHDRYVWARRHLEKAVDHPRFRHFLAVHESEAWLLSDSSIFPRSIREALPKGLREPEDIDFGKPPSVLLNLLYVKATGRRYKKVVNGKDLFDRLDPEVAYQKCPHLRQMLDEMSRLAIEAGQP